MQFRSRFFGVLCILALLWVTYGFVVTSQAVSTVSSTPVPGGSAAQAGRAIGIGLGASLGISMFLCTGGPLVLLFGLLSWRNAAGIRTERRHQEAMAAMQSRR